MRINAVYEKKDKTTWKSVSSMNHEGSEFRCTVCCELRVEFDDGHADVGVCCNVVTARSSSNTAGRVPGYCPS